MKYKLAQLSALIPSPFNPPMREKKVDKLANNIRANGLLVPIVVANDMTIVDGHRRALSLKLIAKQDSKKESDVKVPIIQHNSTSHVIYDAMFIAANEDTMLLNGNQYLWRYMQGASIPNSHLSRIKWLERALGKEYATGMFNRILDRGQSPHNYQMCMGIYCKYTDSSPTYHTAMRKLAYYLLNIENPYRVKSAIAHFIPVKVLKDCVKSKALIESRFAPASQ